MSEPEDMDGTIVEELRHQIANNAPRLKSSSQECMSNDLSPLRAFKAHRNSKCAISQPEPQPHQRMVIIFRMTKYRRGLEK